MGCVFYRSCARALACEGKPGRNAYVIAKDLPSEFYYYFRAVPSSVSLRVVPFLSVDSVGESRGGTREASTEMKDICVCMCSALHVYMYLHVEPAHLCV